MDPTQTLSMLLDNLSSANHPGVSDSVRSNCKRFAANHARDLADWLERGGFPPAVEVTAPRTYKLHI